MIGQDTQADLATIISCCCDPLVAQLQLVAAQLPSCDGAVFLTNNLHQLRTTLSLYPVLPPSSHLILDSLSVRAVNKPSEPEEGPPY